MNITFLIGNGFDINLGIPTKYSDFLEYHTNQGFTDMLSTSMREDLSLWSDVEIGLGDFTKNVASGDIESFLDAKDNLDRSLIEYLKSICSKYILSISNKGIIEFRDKITGFGNEFRREDKLNLTETIRSTNESINYCFITFNYTPYLDEIVKKAMELGPFSSHRMGPNTYNDVINMPFHIHGQLDADMILGVNDRSQIACDDEVASHIAEYMIKTDLNDAVGEQKVALAKQLIDSSTYVCIFGMSMGSSDLFWWKYIMEWLKKSSSRRLVLYKRYSQSNVAAAGAVARRRNLARRDFLTLVGSKEEDATIANQIIVIPNTSVFTYQEIKVVKQDG